MLRSTLRRALGRRLTRTASEVSTRPPTDDEVAFVRQAYRDVLGREADDGGLASWSSALTTGLSRADLLESFRQSPELAARKRDQAALQSMHEARQAWIRELPAARRILDLGGSSTTNPLGALLEMGYPHPFEELVVVDLPQEDRHGLYQTTHADDVLESEQGAVRFLYRSMTDLSDLEDGSFDLIQSGQTFEHISPAEGRHVLREVSRLLSPGGRLALDTPNRALTALQLQDSPEEFINPDHKIEYTHAQMLELFEEAGLTVLHQAALGPLPDSLARGRFDTDELVRNNGMSSDVECGYMLAYICERSG